MPDRDLTTSALASVRGGPVGTAEAGPLAQALKALGDPVRLRLVSLVAASQDGEVTVGRLTDSVPVSAPTVSHHLGVLTRAGLLERRASGRQAYYALAEGRLDAVAEALR